MDAHPPDERDTDTMTTDRDPAVLRAQARARERLGGELAAAIHALAAHAARLDDPRGLDAAALVRLAAELRDLARLATVAEHAAVTLAKDSGATWQAIGDGLSMNRQNAQAKYGKRGTK